MPTLMFQPQFAPMVESGEKRHTIRPRRVRPIKVHDLLYLKEWTGLPYRSKTRALRRAEICLSVQSITINCDMNSEWYLTVDGNRLSDRAWGNMARLDGFQNHRDMLMWFDKTHGLPFEGLLYKW